MKITWPEIDMIILEHLEILNSQTRKEQEIKAIRLRLTLAIIEDILRN